MILYFIKEYKSTEVQVSKWEYLNNASKAGFYVQEGVEPLSFYDRDHDLSGRMVDTNKVGSNVM